jgi:cell division protease FtsH
MITEFGMSEKLGSVRYAGQQMRYLSGVAQDNSHLSPHTQELIDTEVRDLVMEQSERAQTALRENRAALEILTQKLLEQETVDGSAVQEALEAAEAAGAAEPAESGAATEKAAKTAGAAEEPVTAKKAMAKKPATKERS